MGSSCWRSKTLARTGRSFDGLVDGERALLVELGEEGFCFRRERVAGGRSDAGDGGLEVGGEVVDVEFGDEELGEGFRIFSLRVGAAGHLEALERVGAVEGVAERAEDAGDGFFAGGDLAHASEQDGADGAVIVHDLAAFAETVVGVGLGIGHAVEQVFEEQHVQRLRDAGAGDRIAALVEDALGDGEDLEEAVGAVGANDLVERFLECGVVVRHLVLLGG